MRLKTLFSTRLVKTAASVTALAGMLSLSGCIVTAHSSEDESGVRISDSTLQQIEPGSTTKEWVRLVLGAPIRKDTFQPGDSDQEGEIWVYQWERTKSSSGSVIFLIHSSKRSHQSERYYVEFVGDVVNRVWSDESS